MFEEYRTGVDMIQILRSAQFDDTTGTIERTY